MTDERLIELGNRLLDIDKEIRLLKQERAVVNDEIMEYMSSIKMRWIRRGGLSFTIQTKLYGRVVSPFLTVGRSK